MPRGSSLLGRNLLHHALTGSSSSSSSNSIASTSSLPPVTETVAAQCFRTSNRRKTKALCLAQRPFHSSRSLDKDAEDDSIVRSIDITWEDATAEDRQSDPHLQTLLDWKALRSQLEDRLPGSTQAEPARKAISISSHFFDSNASIEIDQVRQGSLTSSSSSSAIPFKEASFSARTRERPLWITSVDEGSLRDATHRCMQDIRNGQRDLRKLALRFMSLVQHADEDFGSSRDLYLEQIRFYLLAQWAIRVEKALIGRMEQVSFLRVCLNITKELYSTSFAAKDKGSWATDAEHANLRSVHRSTLYRLFNVISICAVQRLENHPASLQALSLMSTILKDSRLRPAQRRNLSRRYIYQFSQLVEAQSVLSGNTQLWKRTVTSFLTLMKSGIIITRGESASSAMPEFDLLLRLLCVARSKRQVTRFHTRKLLLTLVRTAQEIAVQSHLASEAVQPTKARIEDIFAPHAFARTSTLREIAHLLYRCGDLTLLREIVFMAPQEQRVLPVLIFLMHYWSNNVATMSAFKQTRRRGLGLGRLGRDVSMLDFRKCSTSERIWTEAISLLDKRDPKYESTLLAIFSARMSSHARSKAPELVASDLRFLQDLLQDDLSKQDVLAMLPASARLNAVRALIRSGRLAKATLLANQILNARASSLKSLNAVETAASDDLDVQLLNLLLGANLRLRKRSGFYIARHRYAVLLQKSGVVKAQGLHSRRTINRYVRGMRQQVLTRYSTSKRKQTFNFVQCLRFLETFCARHGITPDCRTSSVLVNGMRKLESRRGAPARDKMSREDGRIAVDWQWSNIAEIVSRIRMLVTGQKRSVQPQQLARS